MGPKRSPPRRGTPTSPEYEDNRAYGVIAECIQRVASGELSVIINKKFALCDAVKLIEERRAFGPVVLVAALRRASSATDRNIVPAFSKAGIRAADAITFAAYDYETMHLGQYGRSADAPVSRLRMGCASPR